MRESVDEQNQPISGVVIVEAVRRFRHPPAIDSQVMLVVAVVGLMVNAASLFMLRGGAHGSLNVKGAYFEVLSDFLTSVGVIIGAVVMMTTGWYTIDPIISAAIGLFILPRTWLLLREAIGVLLEGTPHDVDLAAVRRTIEGIRGVAGVHDLHVWSLTSGVNALSVHVVAADESDLKALLTRVNNCASRDFHIGHVTVQIEPPDWHCDGPHE